MPRSQSGISVRSKKSIPSQKSSRTSVDEPMCIAAELHDLPEGSESGDSETATEVDVSALLPCYTQSVRVIKLSRAPPLECVLPRWQKRRPNSKWTQKAQGAAKARSRPRGRPAKRSGPRCAWRCTIRVALGAPTATFTTTFTGHTLERIEP